MISSSHRSGSGDLGFPQTSRATGRSTAFISNSVTPPGAAGSHVPSQVQACSADPALGFTPNGIHPNPHSPRELFLPLCDILNWNGFASPETTRLLFFAPWCFATIYLQKKKYHPATSHLHGNILLWLQLINTLQTPVTVGDLLQKLYTITHK